jgi:hypothetical protein
VVFSGKSSGCLRIGRSTGEGAICATQQQHPSCRRSIGRVLGSGQLIGPVPQSSRCPRLPCFGPIPISGRNPTPRHTHRATLAICRSLCARYRIQWGFRIATALTNALSRKTEIADEFVAAERCFCAPCRTVSGDGINASVDFGSARYRPGECRIATRRKSAMSSIRCTRLVFN